MILNTAENLYKYFLAEVRKERTIVITPQRWQAFINPIFTDWVKTKLPEKEFTQKRIDDLEAIKVVTDNVQYPAIHSLYDNGNIFKIPYNEDGYGKYMHGISVEFGIGKENPKGGVPMAIPPVLIPDNPTPIEDPLLIKDLVGGKIFRSDARVVYKNNPYRQPDDNTFVYFEQRGNYIYVIPKEKQFNRMLLEYYRYPTEVVLTGGTPNVGSFQPIQNKEIMDMAVTRYLERVSDQRIQTQPSVSASVPK